MGSLGQVPFSKAEWSTFDIAIIVKYAPTAEAPEEEIEKFYEELEQARKRCNSQEMVIIMGDLNAKVG